MTKLLDHVLGREPSKQLELFPEDTMFDDFIIQLMDKSKELERIHEIMDKVRAGGSLLRGQAEETPPQAHPEALVLVFLAVKNTECL